MNVKRASIVALGNLAEYTEGLFAPHLENALQCLKVLVDYFHHEIRERAAIALQQLVHGACLAHRGPARDPSYSAPPNDEKEPKAIDWATSARTSRTSKGRLCWCTVSSTKTSTSGIPLGSPRPWSTRERPTTYCASRTSGTRRGRRRTGPTRRSACLRSWRRG